MTVGDVGVWAVDDPPPPQAGNRIAMVVSKQREIDIDIVLTA